MLVVFERWVLHEWLHSCEGVSSFPVSEGLLDPPVSQVNQFFTVVSSLDPNRGVHLLTPQLFELQLELHPIHAKGALTATGIARLTKNLLMREVKVPLVHFLPLLSSAVCW